MIESTHLQLKTARGAPLPNTYSCDDAGADTLALLFPGRGYRSTMPLLHYTQRVLLEAGIDVLRLDLAYDLDPDFRDAGHRVQRERIREDARAAFDAGTRQRAYRDVILVGKSLGTWALSDILELAPSPPVVACVWLTPLLHDPALIDTVRAARTPSLFVIGTADPLYDARLLDELGRMPGSGSAVIPDADHGLEVRGDMQATLRAMAAYLDALGRFIDAAGHPV